MMHNAILIYKNNPPKISRKKYKIPLYSMVFLLQDLHRAMVVLGLCPMEQEVIDMTNEVAKESSPEPVFTKNISRGLFESQFGVKCVKRHDKRGR
jgi:hypothetical protein